MNIDGVYTHLAYPSMSYKVEETDVDIEVTMLKDGETMQSHVFPKEAFAHLEALYRRRQTDEQWRYDEKDKPRKWFE